MYHLGMLLPSGFKNLTQSLRRIQCMGVVNGWIQVCSSGNDTLRGKRRWEVSADLLFVRFLRISWLACVHVCAHTPSLFLPLFLSLSLALSHTHTLTPTHTVIVLAVVHIYVYTYFWQDLHSPIPSCKGVLEI